MLQFAQRISAQFHLTGMPAEAARGHTAHQLKVAGAKHEIFTPAARDVIFPASRGLLRVTNQICDYALV